jgi:hypothetical protein
MPWVVRLPDRQQPDNMRYKLQAVPTAKSKENNDLKGSKAKQILVAIDAGLNWYQAARKVDNGVVGP